MSDTAEVFPTLSDSAWRTESDRQPDWLSPAGVFFVWLSVFAPVLCWSKELSVFVLEQGVVGEALVTFCLVFWPILNPRRSRR